MALSEAGGARAWEALRTEPPDLGLLGRAVLTEMRALALDAGILRNELTLTEAERSASREVEAYALSVARSYRGFASQGAARLDEVRERLRVSHGRMQHQLDDVRRRSPRRAARTQALSPSRGAATAPPPPPPPGRCAPPRCSRCAAARCARCWGCAGGWRRASRCHAGSRLGRWRRPPGPSGRGHRRAIRPPGGIEGARRSYATSEQRLGSSEARPSPQELASAGAQRRRWMCPRVAPRCGGAPRSSPRCAARSAPRCAPRNGRQASGGHGEVHLDDGGAAAGSTCRASPLLDQPRPLRPSGGSKGSGRSGRPQGPAPAVRKRGRRWPRRRASGFAAVLRARPRPWKAPAAGHADPF